MTRYLRKFTKWMLCMAALMLVAGTVLPAMAADEIKPADGAPAVAAAWPSSARSSWESP